MDEQFFKAIAPVYADMVDESLITMDDVPDEFKPYVQAVIDKRKKEA
jgi:hypothetical protein